MIVGNHNIMTGNHFDKDGLVYLQYTKVDQGTLLLGEQKIYITPEAKSIFDYLITDDKLWNAARISVSDTDRRMKRAPIFGIPFRQGLQEAFVNKKA